MSQGDEKKHDAGKPRFELIDPAADLVLAMTLTSGAVEYQDDGWLSLADNPGRRRLLGALGRHKNKYQEELYGFAIDPQFGLPHSAHLLACAHFLAAIDVIRLQQAGRWDGVVRDWHERTGALRAAKYGSEA